MPVEIEEYSVVHDKWIVTQVFDDILAAKEVIRFLVNNYSNTNIRIKKHEHTTVEGEDS